MSPTIEEIFKKIDEFDTFLIESGCERNNEMEIISWFQNGSAEEMKATIVISEPNYRSRRDDDDE